MDTPEFEEYIREALDRAMVTLFAKADAYTDPDGDRLRNFKVAAELQHTTPVKALAGMMAKHTVSVYDLIDKSDEEWIDWKTWYEKIGDSINYLLLLSALIHEVDDEGELLLRTSFEFPEEHQESDTKPIDPESAIAQEQKPKTTEQLFIELARAAAVGTFPSFE